MSNKSEVKSKVLHLGMNHYTSIFCTFEALRYFCGVELEKAFISFLSGSGGHAGTAGTCNHDDSIGI